MKTCRAELYNSSVNFTRLASVFLLALALLPASALAGANDFVDDEGKPIALPTPKNSFSLENPGPRKTEAALHDPKVVSRKLVQGLETTRVLTITVPHPGAKSKEKGAKFPIKGIYLVDKDGIVVGYHSFPLETAEVVFETKINGVINYLEIYVECREHGTWLKKVRFN